MASWIMAHDGRPHCPHAPDAAGRECVLCGLPADYVAPADRAQDRAEFAAELVAAYEAACEAGELRRLGQSSWLAD